LDRSISSLYIYCFPLLEERVLCKIIRGKGIREISSLCVIFLPPSELESNRTSFLSLERGLRRGVDYSSPSPLEGEG